MQNIGTNDAIGRKIRRRKALAVALGAVLVVAVAGVLFVGHALSSTQTAGLPGCLLYRFTGLYCAGCGDTRAVYYIMHGQFYQGFRMNPLAVMAAPAVLAMLLYMLVRYYRGKPMPVLRLWMVWSIIAVVVLYMVARNLPWEPFKWLAPTLLPWSR